MYKRLDKLYLILISLGIVYVLIYNIFHYDQSFGYDGEAHGSYIDNILYIYEPGSDVPSSTYTREFFSPPIPYIFPSTINLLCKMYLQSEDIFEHCRLLYSFNNMILQSIMFLFTLFTYKKIFKLLNIDNSLLSTLLLIGVFTANFKAVAMLRGEIYVLLFNSILMYKFIKLFKNNFKYKTSDILLIGSLIGLIALSKQWGFLLFPGYFALVLFIKERSTRIIYSKFLIYTFFTGFIISSWFYFNLFFEYGSFTAFNMEPVAFSFYNQPRSFYLPFESDSGMVFTKPIRPYFRNQFVPVLYSDLWGDYWGYFAFTSRALDIGRNQLLIGDYLARVNIASLIPTLLMILGIKNSFSFSKKSNKQYVTFFVSYVSISILVSFIGFLWFLISYPESSGDTNKATYIIHLFHLIGILSIIYLNKMKISNIKKYYSVLTLLVIVFFHNISAMMSHFPLQDTLRYIKFNLH